MTHRFTPAALALLAASACATSSNAPNEKAESSSAAIRAAEEVGGKHTPDAALHLQLAKEQFQFASSLRGDKNRARADRMLLRAQADAELSLALARSETEKAEALGAIEKVRRLKLDSNR